MGVEKLPAAQQYFHLRHRVATIDLKNTVIEFNMIRELEVLIFYFKSWMYRYNCYTHLLISNFWWVDACSKPQNQFSSFFLKFILLSI